MRLSWVTFISLTFVNLNCIEHVRFMSTHTDTLMILAERNKTMRHGEIIEYITYKVLSKA